MYRLSVTVVGFMFFFTSAQAQDARDIASFNSFVNVRQFLKMCNFNSNDPKANRSLCLGYTSGEMDAYAMFHAFQSSWPWPHICLPPDNFSAGSIAQGIVKMILNKPAVAPEYLDSPAAAAFSEYFATYYRC